MVIIQNADAINAIRDGARLSISDGFPQELGKTVVPVMDMTPDFHRKVIWKGGQNTVTGTTVLYTTPTDKTFYLTSCEFSFVKNAACDIATGGIALTTTADAATIIPLRFALLTLTAERGDKSIVFNPPIKLDKGVNISMTGTFTAGALSRTSAITGYEVADGIN